MDRPEYWALGGAALLIAYYVYRTNRLKRLKLIQRAQSVPKQLKQSSKFAFTSTRGQQNNPQDWAVIAPGYARQGQFGLERRDYPTSGDTHIVTYGDAWVNV